MSLVGDAWIVCAKELRDALRDRRTLLVVLLSSVVLGPVVLVALSSLVATMEARAEQREVYVVGLERAPTLVNHLQRQTWRVMEAPPDHEARLRDATLGVPVLVLPADFEAALRRGDAPRIEVVTDSANRQADAGARRVAQALAGFNRERAMLALALRGVAADLLEPVQVDERDLANAQARGTQITGMLPFFVIIAVLYGALNAALDTTAGERERGSLEPLLATPASRLSLVLGKWGAVAAVAMLIAVLSCASFLPAQWLMRSDTLRSMFQFGLREAGLFLAVLLPFGAALSALLMAVAIRCRTFKEAQANSSVVIVAASLLPMLATLNPGAEARWQLWVPALAQYTLMTRVLKGEGFGAEQIVVPLLGCALLTALSLAYVVRSLRAAAAR